MKTIVLLPLSNISMTFTWYAHFKELGDQAWIPVALDFMFCNPVEVH